MPGLVNYSMFWICLWGEIYYLFEISVLWVFTFGVMSSAHHFAHHLRALRYAPAASFQGGARLIAVESALRSLIFCAENQGFNDIALGLLFP